MGELGRLEVPDTAKRAGRPLALLLVRHAESERNVAKKGNRFFLDDEARKSVQGVSDHRTPLTARGRRQASDTGVALRRTFGAPDYAYHSGYRRTRETTELLLSAFMAEERARIHVRHNPFLRERDTGYTYDMTTAEAEAAFPWLQPYWGHVRPDLWPTARWRESRGRRQTRISLPGYALSRTRRAADPCGHTWWDALDVSDAARAVDVGRDGGAISHRNRAAVQRDGVQVRRV